MLLAGLAVLAGILAAVFTFTDSSEKLSNLVGNGGSDVKPVRLSGITSYDPKGDNHEHSEDARFATDGDAGTFWTTEHYNGGLGKDGVGLVLDAGRPVKLGRLTLTSDTPGFTALIEAGSSSTGGFTSVSASRTVGNRTRFSVDGGQARYYVVWITDLGRDSSVHLNEVTARSR